MSTHAVTVYRIGEIEKHPNADRLGLVRIEGFTAIVRLGDFSPGDLAAYIEPDYVVPDAEPFLFLKAKTRIRSQKLRGVWSQGLLIRAPEGAKEGDDVMARLGIVRYEPKTMFAQGNNNTRSGQKRETSIALVPHKSLQGIGIYDLENWRKHRKALEEGEPVVITEKIHGCNARFAFREGKMYAGSRTLWRKSGEQSFFAKCWEHVKRWVKKSHRPNIDLDKGNVWWRVLRANPWIETFCRENPDVILYGEIFGDVQDLKYGAKPDELFFLAFDVLGPAGYWSHERFAAALPAERRVPVLHVGAYCPEQTEAMSRMEVSTLAGHLSEGIVIKPLEERWHPQVGRVALKLVSDAYLERAS
jgi:RNA ligase (TIGR02306 family)